MGLLVPSCRLFFLFFFFPPSSLFEPHPTLSPSFSPYFSPFPHLINEMGEYALIAAVLLRAMIDIRSPKVSRRDRRLLMRWVLCGSEDGLQFGDICDWLEIPKPILVTWFVRSARASGIDLPPRSRWKEGEYGFGAKRSEEVVEAEIRERLETICSVFGRSGFNVEGGRKNSRVLGKAKAHRGRSS